MAVSDINAEPHHFVQIETPKHSLRSRSGTYAELESGVVADPIVEAPRITLEWKNLALSATVKNATTKTLEQKTILQDVSGFARPGELLVIMGPSGAGKSSLLDCISTRNAGATGTITVNGEPWSESVKRFASYVVQDDLFYATITVREHLMFQAKLRMGKLFTKAQYGARVDTCPNFTNPTDFFMRQLVVLDKAADAAGVQRLQLLKEAWANPQIPTSLLPYPVGPSDGRPLAIDASEYADPRVGFLGQLAVLSCRNALRILRDDMAFKSEALQALIIYVFVSLVYWQLEETQQGIQSFAGAFFYIAIDQMFAAAYPVFTTVPLELPLVFREYKAGLYRVGAWYIAKNASELPQQVVIPIIGFLPAYFMIGFGHGVGVYLKMQLILILLHSASVGLGYWVSCMCRRVEIAPIVGTIIMLPFLLFGGLLVNTESIPASLSWLAYLSPIKYGFEAFMKIFWAEVSAIPCDDAVAAEGVVCLARTGADVLRNYSLNNHALVLDALALLGLNVAFRLLGYLALVGNHLEPTDCVREVYLVMDTADASESSY
ncbi:hypothetical protein PybrP1_002946, partial [[Pythium] brassicae (nom. inval.)]